MLLIPAILLFPLVLATSVSLELRAYYMRQTFTALSSPCQRYPFAAVIVNHTATPPVIVCSGSNSNSAKNVNPVMHGEISAIMACSEILGPNGGWEDLSLYTNAESCPMCASAIRWAGFKEYIFGTSIETLIEKSWAQITISSEEVFQRSEALHTDTTILSGVLANETDALFSWQWAGGECPRGCGRTVTGSCAPAKEAETELGLSPCG